MLELEENSKLLEELKNKLNEIKDSMKIESLRRDIEKLESETAKEDFWQDQDNSNLIFSKLKKLQKKVNKYDELSKKLDSLLEMNELLEIEFEQSLVSDLISSTENLNKELDLLKIETLFSGKYDFNNAILTLHPGAGGTESHDWVQMLYRMYTRWATQNGFNVKELDYLAGDEAGIKSVTFIVTGDNAYGYLKGEMGVHRLVRISPFDAGGRRHTSFASLEVLPEITDDVEVEINPDDLRIDTYRASGAGGQHINKTDSAIRITHLPTNIVVTCQSERSQTMNKETAMKMLKSKLIDLKEKENKETISELKGEQKEIAWGSQIRSYVFCPYTLVKDYRTNYEVGNVESVMDGNLTDFMIAYLKNLLKS